MQLCRIHFPDPLGRQPYPGFHRRRRRWRRPAARNLRPCSGRAGSGTAVGLAQTLIPAEFQQWPGVLPGLFIVAKESRKFFDFPLRRSFLSPVTITLQRSRAGSRLAFRGGTSRMTSTAQLRSAAATPRLNLPFIIGASSVGTLIEWYDFYLYGVLALFFSKHFFAPDMDPNVAFIASLFVFWTGFLVRPFGAIVFGHLGDLIGRKFTFMLTLMLMGSATFVVGLLPGYDSIGVLAPVLLVAMRVLQGLALGGEYGGAATYIAEHSPDGRRGFYTSWIQTTATMGIVLALLVILICRLSLGDQAFGDWGWRVPFLISAILVLLSIYIRLKLEESPLYARLKEQGKSSANPALESFGSGKNWKLILLALFGATAPEGVVWYTGQFYALFYMTAVLKINYVTVYIIMMVC